MNGGVPQTESQRSDDEANPGDRSAVVAEMRRDTLHHRHEEQENTSPEARHHARLHRLALGGTWGRLVCKRDDPREGKSKAEETTFPLPVDDADRQADGHRDHHGVTHRQVVDRREHAVTVQSKPDPHDHGDAEPTQAEMLAPGLLAHDENDRRGDQNHPRDGVGSRDAQDRSGQS